MTHFFGLSPFLRMTPSPHASHGAQTWASFFSLTLPSLARYRSWDCGPRRTACSGTGVGRGRRHRGGSGGAPAGGGVSRCPVGGFPRHRRREFPGLPNRCKYRGRPRRRGAGHRPPKRRDPCRNQERYGIERADEGARLAWMSSARSGTGAVGPELTGRPIELMATPMSRSSSSTAGRVRDVLPVEGEHLVVPGRRLWHVPCIRPHIRNSATIGLFSLVRPCCAFRNACRNRSATAVSAGQPGCFVVLLRCCGCCVSVPGIGQVWSSAYPLGVSFSLSRKVTERTPYGRRSRARERACRAASRTSHTTVTLRALEPLQDDAGRHVLAGRQSRRPCPRSCAGRRGAAPRLCSRHPARSTQSSMQAARRRSGQSPPASSAIATSGSHTSA